MHPVGQQQQRRSNSTRMPLMYPPSLPPAPLLPPPTLRYGGLGTYQQSTSGSGGGGGGGGMKHHQSRGGNRGGRGSTTTHRQQRPATNSRYHPYPFRQPLPPQQQQQRSYRPAHPLPRTPAALMGTPPGMSQSEYELIHSAQVQRDKKKLDVLAPSNTTQFLIRDHNRQSTPTSMATPTPTHQTNSSPSVTQNQPSLPYDQMFEMNEVDAQSDDTESNQDIGIGGVDLSFDNDFNDIYYQCRYERYAAFNRANLLNEVLSLCANIDRLQHEKSEVEKRLRDVQQHLYDSTSTSNNNQDRSTNEETSQTNDEDSRPQSPVHDQQQNETINGDDVTHHVADELQASTSSQPITTEEKDNDELLVGENSSQNNENEQQIVHD